jgi:hypothetical protein
MANADLRNREKEYAAGKYARRVAMLGMVKQMAGCIDCGYDKHPAALDFDHVPGYVKTKAVALLAGASLKKLFEEVEKTEVRCANCHRIKTVERGRACL